MLNRRKQVNNVSGADPDKMLATEHLPLKEDVTGDA
jgi:hypothetical protein